MKGFNYYAPLRIIFENGSIDQIGQLTARNGRRVLLVTGRNHLKKTGHLERILSALKNVTKIEEVVLFNYTPQNPDVEAVESAKRLIIEKKLNVVVAIGGGSSMDLAKTASICAKNNISFWELYNSNSLPILNAYPIICCPTTSGSGSEVTKYAVINDNSKRVKVAISNLSLYPKVSLIDPELTYTMPENVIANTGFDALSHAIEAYTSRSSCPITDTYCREAISLIGTNLINAYLTKDKMAMQDMSLAAMFAGMALNVGRASLPHALEHNLSAYNPNLPHGLGLAIVMIPFLKRAVECNKEKFADIAYLLGKNISNKSLVEAANLCVDAVKELKDKLSLNKTLKDFGFNRQTIEEMVENNFWTMKHGIQNSPCDFTKGDVINIYLEALEEP